MSEFCSYEQETNGHVTHRCVAPKSHVRHGLDHDYQPMGSLLVRKILEREAVERRMGDL